MLHRLALRGYRLAASALSHASQLGPLILLLAGVHLTMCLPKLAFYTYYAINVRFSRHSSIYSCYWGGRCEITSMKNKWSLVI
jgi:hypothetical protein